MSAPRPPVIPPPPGGPAPPAFSGESGPTLLGVPGAPPPPTSPTEPAIEAIRTPAEPRTGGRRRGILVWALLGLVGLAFVTFLFAIYLPEHHRAEDIQVALDARSENLESAKAELAAALAQTEQLQGDKDGLIARLAELGAEHGELVNEIAKKEAELQAIQERLSENLGDQIAAGEVAIKRVNGELVVDVASKVLFHAGEAELNPRGQAVLRPVAETMRANPGRVFQIAGHTDNSRVSERLQEEFPTNWELSTARATNVVRFLEEQCKVRGRQLVATGFAHHRPKASNRSRRGKRRNRRIEITVLRKPRKDR